MFFLVSYSDEYLTLAIHADSSSKEGCQQVLRELLISRIQEKYGHDKDTANIIYDTAKNAKTADDEDACRLEYGIDIHVYEDGGSIDDGSYTDTYQIVDYVPSQCK